MKAVVKNKESEKKSIKTSRKRLSTELSESQLRRFKEALVSPVADEPVGVLAGVSFTFSS